MEIRRVGVIGAGQMGNGIAHVFALAGFDVTLNDVSEAALAAAPGIIRGNLDRQVRARQDRPRRTATRRWRGSRSSRTRGARARANWSSRRRPRRRG